MAALITRKRVRALYDALRVFPPFCRWKLPPGDRVRFVMVDDLATLGTYSTDSAGRHVIGLNAHILTSWPELCHTLMHEMVHMRQECAGRRPITLDEQHNREFYRLRKMVCQQLGLEPEKI